MFCDSVKRVQRLWAIKGEYRQKTWARKKCWGLISGKEYTKFISERSHENYT